MSKHIITKFDQYNKINEQEDLDAQEAGLPDETPEAGAEETPEEAPAPEATNVPAPETPVGDLFAQTSEVDFDAAAQPLVGKLIDEIKAQTPSDPAVITDQIKSFVQEKLGVETKDLVKYGDAGSKVLKIFEPVLTAMSSAGVPKLTEAKKQ